MVTLQTSSMTPNWSANWSSATDEVTSSRISTTDVIDTSVSANEDSLRKLAMAYTMVSELGLVRHDTGGLRCGDHKGNRAHRIGHSGPEQRYRPGGQRPGAGFRRLGSYCHPDRPASMNASSSWKMSIPTEASVKLSNAVTQLELTYIITSRMQNLSLPELPLGAPVPCTRAAAPPFGCATSRMTGDGGRGQAMRVGAPDISLERPQGRGKECTRLIMRKAPSYRDHASAARNYRPSITCSKA